MSGKTMRFNKAWVIGLVVGGIALFAVANAHLLTVALQSQPDCVEHLKSAGSAPGAFRAAKSAC